jgi:hypothetical protein
MFDVVRGSQWNRRRFLTDIIFVAGALIGAAWLSSEATGGPAKPSASPKPVSTRTPTSSMRGDFVSPAASPTPRRVNNPHVDGDFSVPVKPTSKLSPSPSQRKK